MCPLAEHKLVLITKSDYSGSLVVISYIGRGLTGSVCCNDDHISLIRPHNAQGYNLKTEQRPPDDPEALTSITLTVGYDHSSLKILIIRTLKISFFLSFGTRFDVLSTDQQKH